MVNSIVIPCYNSESYLERCLNSVLNQTCKNIELIIINDGSTDGTETIINQYLPLLEKNLTRVIYRKQCNKGVGAACNKGFKLATGETFSLLDSDDYLLPESVEKRSNWLMNHPDYAMVRTNGYYQDENFPDKIDRLFEYDNEQKNKENIFELVFYSRIVFWPGSYMIRMATLDKVYPDREILPSRFGQNLQFLFPISKKYKAGFIDDPLMIYVVRKQSLSHEAGNDGFLTRLNNIKGYKEIEKRMIERFIDPSEQEYWLEKLRLFWGKQKLYAAIEHGEKDFAKMYYRELNCTYHCLDYDYKIYYYNYRFKPFSLWYRFRRRINSSLKLDR